MIQTLFNFLLDDEDELLLNSFDDRVLNLGQLLIDGRGRTTKSVTNILTNLFFDRPTFFTGDNVANLVLDDIAVARPGTGTGVAAIVRTGLVHDGAIRRNKSGNGQISFAEKPEFANRFVRNLGTACSAFLIC